MHKVVCWLGFAPPPVAPHPDPLAVFRRPTSKGRGKEEDGREEKDRGGEGGSLSFALGRKKKKVGAYEYTFW